MRVNVTIFKCPVPSSLAEGGQTRLWLLGHHRAYINQFFSGKNVRDHNRTFLISTGGLVSSPTSLSTHARLQRKDNRKKGFLHSSKNLSWQAILTSASPQQKLVRSNLCLRCCRFIRFSLVLNLKTN